MEFKKGDKVRVVDLTKVCFCRDCRATVILNEIYVIKNVEVYEEDTIRTRCILEQKVGKDSLYLVVMGSGLEKVGEEQLVFAFMEN